MKLNLENILRLVTITFSSLAFLRTFPWRMIKQIGNKRNQTESLKVRFYALIAYSMTLIKQSVAKA